RATPASWSQLQNPGVKLHLRLGRDQYLDPRTAVGSKPKTQEMSLLRSRQRTLRLVDLKPQSVLQISTRRGHDPFPGSLAPHEYITIIGVAHEPESTAFQLPVPFVQDDIGQQRRQRAALRSALFRGNFCTVRQPHLCLQHPPHQVQNPGVARLLPQSVEQALMM